MPRNTCIGSATFHLANGKIYRFSREKIQKKSEDAVNDWKSVALHVNPTADTSNSTANTPNSPARMGNLEENISNSTARTLNLAERAFNPAARTDFLTAGISNSFARKLN